MDYAKEFRKFITSQYLYSGVRLTVAILLPAIVLYQLGLLQNYMAIPMGALCVGLTDNPGPAHHRRNSLLASALINFAVFILTAFARAHPVYIIIEIIFFGMFFSLIGVYGNRVSSIGLMALLVFVFNIDSHLSNKYIFENALWFGAGGMFYVLMSLLLQTLRPYKIIQQMLGECIMETADFLQVKANFYEKNAALEKLDSRLLHLQVNIQQHHADIREVLFKNQKKQ